MLLQDTSLDVVGGKTGYRSVEQQLPRNAGRAVHTALRPTSNIYTDRNQWSGASSECHRIYRYNV